MRVIFMGTPEFAVPSLKRLLQDGHEVALVVTQPDKPVGRKHLLTPPPVKAYALTENLPVFQPEKLKTDEVYERLSAMRPDVMVVVAYGRILSQRLLDLPRYGCINVHGSLLPKYRGAAPIQWTVLNGEREAGVTTMQMDAGLDTGDMLKVVRRPVPEDMTSGELYGLLSEDGAQALSDTLRELEAGTLTRTPQPQTGDSYAPMLDKSLSPLDFTKPAPQLHNQVRGLNPWPSASCLLDGKTLKIHRSRVAAGGNAAAPGTVVSAAPLVVACGGGTALELCEVQYEGGRRMAAADFLRGHPLPAGTVIG